MTEPTSEFSNLESADLELMNRLARLDPVLSEASPTVDSPQLITLKEHIMSSTESFNPNQPRDQRAAAGEPARPRRRRLRLLAGAGSVAAAGLLAVTLIGPGASVAAADQIRAAADNTSELTDFRIHMVSNDGFFPAGEATAEVDGDSFRMTSGNFEMIGVGTTEWILADGEVVEVNTFSADEAVDIAPYAESSAAVITAALASASITDAGTETLNGVETTRYDIEMDDAAQAALAAVPSANLEWFAQAVDEDVEAGEEGVISDVRSGYLEDADALSIWIADDLVHRIAVTTGSTQFTHTFFDFGADITVSAPE